MIERVGAVILAALAWVGDVTFFGLRALREAFRPPFEFAETLRHIYEIGWKSAPLIATSGFAVGVVLSMHTLAWCSRCTPAPHWSGSARKR
jgi:ABC-type transporter Mla maintaining outer membrane lipid asymmetry permease subunit MlaE